MNTEQRDGTKLGASLCNTNNILVWYSYCPVYIVSALCNTTSTTRSIILRLIYLGKKEFMKLFVVLHEKTNLFLKKSLFKVCLIKNISRQTSLARQISRPTLLHVCYMSAHVWLEQRAVCCLLLEVRRLSKPIKICRGMRKVFKKTIFANQNN